MGDRELFRSYGGSFHGPRVEHASCEEQAFWRFVREVRRLAWNDAIDAAMKEAGPNSESTRIDAVGRIAELRKP